MSPANASGELSCSDGTGSFSLMRAVAGHTVATILCDGAYRYQSRLFSKAWLKAKGLEDAIPEHLKKYAVLD